MDSEQKMTFLYSTDDDFVHVLASSLYSLLASHLGKGLKVYIAVDSAVSNTNKKLLLEIGNRFQCELQFLQNPNFSRKANIELDIKRYAFSMFSRIVAGSILPLSVKRVIYLDCDTMITAPLDDLWDYDLNGKTIGAVNDSRSRAYSRNLGIRRENCYVNSGVLLMDLESYRQKDCEWKLLQALRQLNGMLEFPDNDIICKILQDDIAYLPPRFNVTSVLRMCSYRELVLLRHPANGISRREFDEARRNPAIVHFTTFFLMKDRPWFQGCNHPDTEAYCALRTKAIQQMPLLPMHKSLPIGRWIRKLARALPRGIVIPLAGLAHGYIKPWIQSLRMRKCRQTIEVYPIASAADDWLERGGRSA